MKVRELKTLLILFLLSFATLSYALELGSERFTNFTEGTPDYPVMVGMGKDPQISSNYYFSNQDFVRNMRNHPFPEGTGHKAYIANMMNFQGNYVMAGAKTDPRSTGFLMNSMDRLLSDPNAEVELIEGISSSKLKAEQAGDNAKRYIAAELITPSPGYYQTADNERAFESAYDNVLLGKAEEALYKGDASSGQAYFTRKAIDYKNTEEKQFSAGNFHKDALLRSKKTAETFRDFFQMKAAISQDNLSQMPTSSSLVSNCKKNTPDNIDQFDVYRRALPSEEISFYGLQQPEYGFDFCDVYVDKEQEFLIQNQPVHGQLDKLVQDSSEMAEGLDQLSRDLSDKNLTTAQIANILNSNKAWDTLSKRASAYKECEKEKCLDDAAKVLQKMVEYPGAENHRSADANQIRLALKRIIQEQALNGELPKIELTGIGDAGKKIQKNNFGLKNNSGKLHDSSLSKTKSTAAPTDPQISIVNGKEVMAYHGKRFSRGNGYFRGEDGVLRNPQGFPVTEFLAPAHLNLFDIISRRYQIKFYESQEKIEAK